MYKYVLIILVGLIGWGVYETQKPEPIELGIATYKSIQVGASPTANDVLQTDGTDSTWVTCATLTGSADLCDGTDATSAGGGTYPFDPSTSWGSLAQSTTSIGAWRQMLIASSTTGRATIGTLTATSSLTVTPLTSALVLTDSVGLFAEYTGVDCTNQFIRDLSALGAGTCATIVGADVDLADLTATDGTLTFSGTYDGQTARTIGLNLANANTWTGLITYNAGLTGINATSTGTAYLNRSYQASSTVGNLIGGTIRATSTLTIATTTSGCAEANSSGLVWFTGSACGSGGGGNPEEKWATSTNLTTFIYPNSSIDIGVGIGTTTPRFQLQVASSSSAVIALTDTSAGTNDKHAVLSWNDGIFRLGTTSDTSFNSTSTALTINPKGAAAMFIGTTTNAANPALAVAGKWYSTGLTTESGAGNVLCLKTNGEIVQDDSPLTACSGASSRSLKKDILSVNSRDSLQKILAMNPVTFRYKQGDSSLHYGFILEELQEVAPELIEKGTSVKYIETVALLTSAIQAHQKEINNLKRGFSPLNYIGLLGLLGLIPLFRKRK